MCLSESEWLPAQAGLKITPATLTDNKIPIIKHSEFSILTVLHSLKCN